MPIRNLSWMCTWVNIERTFDLLYFMREKTSLHVILLRNTLSEFRAELRNSENRDAGKET
jgi:hypothetical protein